MNFLEAMKFRHACKIFDENKKNQRGRVWFYLGSGQTKPEFYGVRAVGFPRRAKSATKAKDPHRLVGSASDHDLLAFGSYPG